jgi:hypothetical protein
MNVIYKEKERTHPMHVAYILTPQEYSQAQAAFQKIQAILKDHNPHFNQDAEQIPDLDAPVTLTTGVLHDLEHQLSILASQLGY